MKTPNKRAWNKDSIPKLFKLTLIFLFLVKPCWPLPKAREYQENKMIWFRLQDRRDTLTSQRFVMAVHCCDRKSRAACAQSFALWQQATIEFTCLDHSPRTLVVTFNRSHARIIRDYTPRSLYYCLFAPHICMVLFFTHIPFVVNHTINATPPERLQQYHLCFHIHHFIYYSYPLLHLTTPTDN